MGCPPSRPPLLWLARCPRSASYACSAPRKRKSGNRFALGVGSGCLAARRCGGRSVGGSRKNLRLRHLNNCCCFLLCLGSLARWASALMLCASRLLSLRSSLIGAAPLASQFTAFSYFLLCAHAARQKLFAPAKSFIKKGVFFMDCAPSWAQKKLPIMAAYKLISYTLRCPRQPIVHIFCLFGCSHR